ncbi:hypothetical protein NE237_003626 [Protea cynaroides]|uniref:CRAL-TRIO domain-containing protein n=1 Tax=Protea cynaroides TaxID=273540 RepID=A0A9Q0QST1_9MAGN|nr:hypothetical protein NE237_003626 [Protea cynaroides]
MRKEIRIFISFCDNPGVSTLDAVVRLGFIEAHASMVLQLHSLLQFGFYAYVIYQFIFYVHRFVIMGDSVHFPPRSKNLEVPSVAVSKKASEKCFGSCVRDVFFQKRFKHITSMDHFRLGSGTAGHIAFFLVKIMALEVVRRFSKAKCPFAWRGLQGFQLLCYPPFKWIQRWSLFRGLVKGMQSLSRPFLLLSIVTPLSDRLEYGKETSDHVDDSQVCAKPHTEQSITDTRTCNLAPQSLPSENWLLQLCKELEQQGISLPERINEDELRRFYAAANGDFLCLLSSIKKTIRWRETYNILSEQKLEMWSHLVFWHGYDVKLRPCLIIRLGLACSTLASHDRPRFAQAVVSQIEHGVLHLVNEEDPQIMVLIDCEGISPFKFPMHMMRSCSVLVQDHYPNRLGCLLVIRLPPVVRVIAQTFIQILKPITRKKLRIEGDMYQKVLSEYLKTVPSFLDGKCTCAKCSRVAIDDTWSHTDETDYRESSGNSIFGEDPPLVGDPCETELQFDGNCQPFLRIAIVSMLIFFIFIALIGGMYDPESLALPF